MKKILLKSILLGASGLASLASFAGGIDEVSCCQLPRIDIPELREGWGFSVEGSALRGYNNNLNYFTVLSTSAFPISDTDSSFGITRADFRDITPVYAFGLRVGVNYTLANSGNIIKLSYEHLFNRTASDGVTIARTDVDLTDGAQVTVTGLADGSVKQKFDGVTLLSEQHILIGPRWEATLSGGARFAHLQQDLAVGVAQQGVVSSITDPLDVSISISQVGADYFNLQFNGVGPLAGLGGIFHWTDTLAFGAEVQGALLMGRQKMTSNEAFAFAFSSEGEDLTQVLDYNPVINRIYSMVPELYYRLYANYFYRFNDGSELQIEAGWRANQFFNVRSFSDFETDNNSPGVPVNITSSDDIGFSGPYLMFNYKL